MAQAARQDDSAAREAIGRLWRASETDCVPPLIEAAGMSAAQRARIEALARRLVEALRGHGPGRGLEAWLQDFPLSSRAGTALLTLVEALLRVPDAASADRLIRDRLAGVCWRELAPGASAARWLAVAAWLTGARVRPLALAAALTRLGAPPLRAALRLGVSGLSGRFVLAETIEQALARVAPHERYSFDPLGEAALTAADAQRYEQAYRHAIRAVGAACRGQGAAAGGSVSVKLSALHPRYEYAQRGRVLAELLPRLRSLAALARDQDIALMIDAEEAERLELSLDLIAALMRDRQLSEWPGLGVAVQAYQKRAPAIIDYLLGLATTRRARLMLRLVKGAYWDAEIKQAQMQGLDGYAVYTRKLYTDVAYLACARRLLEAREHVLAQFATHNAHTVAAIIELAGSQTAAGFEFERLYGMGAGLYAALRRVHPAPIPVRVYAPVGARRILLPYLMRRLLENGAAGSFIHRAFMPEISVERLCADPLAAAVQLQGRAHPRIALPADLFRPERTNSHGLQLADPTVQSQLSQALAASRAQLIDVAPIVAAPLPCPSGQVWRALVNPANRDEPIGRVLDADEATLEAALQAAVGGAASWAHVPIEERARTLERASQRFEAHGPELIALTVREAGKTLGAALGELREAVDALRYYSAQIRAGFAAATHVPLGVVACISPWNFPLAIFTGQLAAALAAGNAVIAKPAEQTNATAALAVRLLHEAGVPRAALQLLPGTGERVGARLVADERVGGVLFTGSTAAARAIARALAPRGAVPLIAETGGQNAMIVDSTALPEQVVADALSSAFDSAGQRCSALRILCLQEQVAEPMLAMLEGAMRELRLGDPSRIETDVGPLIDADAQSHIAAHLAKFSGAVRCRSALGPELARGSFVAPTLIEIDSPAQLREEVFGPVLHVLRFNPRHLGRLVDAINATGYALTLGVHSRIEATVRAVVARARAGNIYVNRNMIGAVIGVQPFGGQGLSGTGPKSGGPLYLHALLRQSPGWRPRPDPAGRCPRALRTLTRWLSQGGGALAPRQRAQLLAQAEHYGRATLLGTRLALRGCVGESNELTLRPRGTLRATAGSLPALLHQLAAALASGNRLIADDAPLAAQLRAALPAPLRPALADTKRSDPDGCAAVLFDGAEARAAPQRVTQLRLQLAEHIGPIVPLLVGEAAYPLERLLVEQTVTINTAAVGGNRELLGLSDEPESAPAPGPGA